ncbi:hypothetical protein QP938_01930 [Porticoccaceae bacterium LTM1]|nr:hypothetical protein QP938_01930 [Porticoccaceae bacterium LTM1]
MKGILLVLYMVIFLLLSGDRDARYLEASMGHFVHDDGNLSLMLEYPFGFTLNLISACLYMLLWVGTLTLPFWGKSLLLIKVGLIGFLFGVVVPPIYKYFVLGWWEVYPSIGFVTLTVVMALIGIIATYYVGRNASPNKSV